MNEDRLEEIFEEALELAKRKNEDYGDEPMTKFSEKGALIRMYDKTERLYTLLWENGDRQVKDETIRDTALDIINYSAYLIMLKEGKFEEENDTEQTKLTELRDKIEEEVLE